MIKWILGPILWIAVNIFLQPLLSLAKRLQNKVAIVAGRDRGYA